MAAPFGVWELSTAQYTRAVFDEFDEEDDENYSDAQSNEAAIKLDFENDVQCSLFVLAVGKVSTSFTNAFVLSSGSKLIGNVIYENKKKDTSVRTHGSDSSCSLFSLNANPEAIVCQCEGKIEPQRCVEWADQVIAKLNPSQVVILTSSPSCHYQTQNPDMLEPDFVRSLKTDCWKEQIPFLFLEQPNTVTDLPASVLSHCQVHGIPAVLYICYTESSLVDVRSVKVLKNS